MKHSPACLTKSSISLALATLLMTTALTVPVSSAMADNLPSWGNLSQVGGSFDTDTSSPNVTNITLNTSRAIGEGNADIYKEDTVNVKGALFVVRDNRASDPTRILGKLNSTGEIIVIDTNGVFFGKDSVVNVQSIVASTGDIANADILDGNGTFEITGLKDGVVELNGTVNVAEAGLAAFVSPYVQNNGVINARLGKVAFAAGEKVTIDLYGDELVEIQLDGKVADALLENTGEINAEGGVVQITAEAAKEAVDNIINLDGVTTVASATQEGGKIVLSGGEAGVVNVSGKVDASGTDGGSVEVTGQNINISETAELKADGGQGEDGKGQGGQVEFLASNAAIFRGSIYARGGALGGDGGYVDTSGLNYIEIDGKVDASAANGLGGLWYIDPRDLLISDKNENLDGNGSFGNPFIPNDGVSSGSTSFVDVADIVAALEGGSNVFITTVGSPDGNGDGDIRVQVGINPLMNVSTATLSLEALSDILFENTGGINAGGAHGLNLDFDAINGDITVGVNGINTNGGSVDFDAAGNININALVTAGAGLIDFTGAKVDLNSNVSSTTSVNFNAPLVELNADIDAPVITGTATNVSVESDAAEIQDGVDISASGATVNVAAGTYDSVIVNKTNLTLNGANAGISGYSGGRGAETIIQAGSPGILVAADGVSVDGVAVDGGDPAGIQVTNADNVTVKNSVVDSTLLLGGDPLVRGIQFTNSDNGTVEFNLVQNTTNDGIRANSSNNFTAYNNQVDYAGGDGIELLYSDNGILEENIIGTAGPNSIALNGVNVFDSNAVRVVSNTIMNTVRHGVKFSLADSDYIKILSNDINNVGYDGVFGQGSNDSLIKWNDISNAGFDGVELHESMNTKIAYNDIYNVGSDETDGNGIALYDNVGTIAKRNKINTTTYYGIFASNETDSTIKGNKIWNTTLDGIYGRGSTGTEVLRNKVNNTGRDGIRWLEGDDTVIAYNKIGLWDGANNIGAQGINVFDSDDTDVLYNRIKNTTFHGVRAILSDIQNVNIVGNWIRMAGYDGVHVHNGDGNKILWNDIAHVGFDGIELREGSMNTKIAYNKIDDVGAGSFDGNGIALYDNTNTLIKANWVSNTTDHGIFANNETDSVIRWNKVWNTVLDGIHGFDSSGVKIIGNKIDNTGRDGIRWLNNEDTLIAWNKIGLWGGANNIGAHGINIFRSDDTNVFFNKVENTTFHGIRAILNDNQNVNVVGNWIRMAGFDGVHVQGGIENAIKWNNISQVGFDGVELSDSTDSKVYFNWITNAGTGLTDGNGIALYDNSGARVVGNTINEVTDNGIFANGDTDLTIKNNFVNNAEVDGIHTLNVVNLLIDNNVVLNSGEDGINIVEDDEFNNDEKIVVNAYMPTPNNVTIINNYVENSGERGLYVEGYGHDSIYLGNNLFLNNPIGARFESGAIDLGNPGDGNTFVNINPAAIPVGLQFELANPFKAESLTIVNETLGETVFSGFLNTGSFYVRFEDGAILDGMGNVIVIDGQNASFDGIIPANFGGVLPAPILNFIEERLYDADDFIVNGRGQIFVANPQVFVGPNLGIDNIEDFFRNIEGFNPGPNALNVTIQGLPYIQPPVGGIDGGPVALNNIAPAAGDDGDLADIEPEAGGNGENVTASNQTPSGTSVPCWSDAVNTAEEGTIANFTFGGSFAESIANEAACGTENTEAAL